MARPRLDFGEVGSVSCPNSADPKTGKYRARCQYRDQAGKIRYAEANNKSRERAIRECRKRATEKAQAGNSTLNLETEFSQIIELWKRVEHDRMNAGKIREETLGEYLRQVDKRIQPGLGHWTLRNLKSPGRLDEWVRQQADGHYSVHRDLRRLLVDILGVAVRKGVLEYNPAESIDKAEKPKKEKITFTPEEVRAILDAVTAFEDPTRYEKKKIGGRRRAVYLYDLCVFMLSTGTRISEALGVRWEDIQLTSAPVLVSIEGQVKTRKKKKPEDSYLYWSPDLKTKSSKRTLSVHGGVVDVLFRRHVGNDIGSLYVFANENGGLRSPSNVRTHLRKAIAEAKLNLPANKTHSFRKTFLTWVDEDEGIQTAAIVAGHSEVSVTERAYVNRSTVAPDIGDPLGRRLKAITQPG